MMGIDTGPYFVISCLTHTLFVSMGISAGIGMGNIAGTPGYTHATAYSHDIYALCELILDGRAHSQSSVGQGKETPSISPGFKKHAA